MFSDWTYEDYVKQFEKDKSVRFIEPMSSHELELNYDVPDNENHLAELKYDGHRGLIFIGEKNRAFSRRISKKTGWYSENSDCIPHIRDLDLSPLFGTVLDGEFDYGNTSMGVQSVLGSLPERAIEFQEEHGYIPFKAFDIIYYKGVNIQKLPLWKRKVYLAKAIMEIHAIGGEEVSGYWEYANMYMNKEQRTNFYKKVLDYTNNNDENDTSDLELQYFIHSSIHIVDSFAELFADVISRNLEGIMVKSMGGIYEQKRSKNYLKVKGQSTWDCVVMGFTPPTKEYDGKEIKKWNYWEADGQLITLSGEALAKRYAKVNNVEVIPVTKPYFMGWCGAIEFGVWKEFTEEQAMEYYGAYEGVFDSYSDQLFDEGVLRHTKDGNYLILVHVGDCKGLSEKELDNILFNKHELIGKVVEVRANGIIDPEKGTLRHPRFEKWRDDKNSEQCTWNDHIRKL